MKFLYFAIPAILFCSVLSPSAKGQGFYQSYQPANSTVRDVLRTDDGGYFMTGQAAADKTLSLLRTDTAGQVLWANQLSLNEARGIAACPAHGGGFIVLAENYLDGSAYQNIVLKIADDGTLVWSRPVPNTTANGLRDIIALNDGTYLAAGNTVVSQNQRNWVVKIDADGNIVWDKTFSTATNVTVRRLAEMPNGNIAVAGFSTVFYLAAINPNATMLWERSYAQPGNHVLHDLATLPDGSITLLGSANAPSEGLLYISMLKAAMHGDMIWCKKYYPFPYPAQSIPLPVASTFVLDDAGNYYLPFWGLDGAPEDEELTLMKVAPNGNAQGKTPLGINGNAWAATFSTDNYIVLAGDNNGSPLQATLIKTDLEGDFWSNRIKGTLYRDVNMDCSLTSGEPPLNQFNIRAENAAGEVFYTNTKPDGSFELKVTEGDFNITASPIYAPLAYYSPCDTPTVGVWGANQLADLGPVMMRVLGDCPMLSVNVGAGLLRRCLPAEYNVNWRNNGNLLSENTRLLLVHSPKLSYLSSSMPLAAQSGDTLFFDLPDLFPDDFGSMKVQFKLSCNAAIGDVICVSAYIFPDTSCAGLGIDWDGSIIEVSGACAGDEVMFKIENKGSGNMTESIEYVIIEDEIMFKQQQPVMLEAGSAIEIFRTVTPDDSCFALLALPNSRSLLSNSVAVVQNCLLGNGNLSLLLHLPSGNNALATTEHCAAVIGAFDPNDKTGFPLGFTEEHYIERGQDIEYRIRFQNTGNDTAFLVVIRDTLPVTLDPQSVRPLTSSHEFQWSLGPDRLLTFSFPNILLPDSSTNEPTSHGFVNFLARQVPGLPDGTRIENFADIYFDFNEPIRTNTWHHTIGRPTTVKTAEPPQSSSPLVVSVSPQPAASEAQFHLSGPWPEQPLRLSVYDHLGKKVCETVFQSRSCNLPRKNLPTGLYFWKIETSDRNCARGKLIFSPH